MMHGHTQRKWYVTRASSRDVRSTQRVVRPVRAQRLQLNVIAFRYTVLAIVALRDRGLGRPACDTTPSTSTLALSMFALSFYATLCLANSDITPDYRPCTFRGISTLSCPRLRCRTPGCRQPSARDLKVQI